MASSHLKKRSTLIQNEPRQTTIEGATRRAKSNPKFFQEIFSHSNVPVQRVQIDVQKINQQHTFKSSSLVRDVEER